MSAVVTGLSPARDVAALHERWPGWLITTDAGTCTGLPVFSARRPGLVITAFSAAALETELLMWERAPGAPDLRDCP